MVRPLLQSGLSGLAQASDSFDRAAARVTLSAAAPSIADGASTVTISPEARAPNPSLQSGSGTGLEGALADTRVAKYAFMANLKVLQTGDEMADALTKLGQTG